MKISDVNEAEVRARVEVRSVVNLHWRREMRNNIATGREINNIKEEKSEHQGSFFKKSIIVMNNDCAAEWGWVIGSLEKHFIFEGGWIIENWAMTCLSWL